MIRYAAAVVALLLARSAAADCASALTTEVIPLPVYATLPNEGDTWGAMPVVLRICPDDRRTESIIAPSVTWNDVIHVTGTFRLYHYPSDETTLTVIGSASTNINYNALLIWQRLPTAVGRWSDEVTLRLQRSVFFRFFGFGPDTPADAETSYTGFHAIALARRGLNVARYLNVGVSVGIERNGVESIGVPGLPLSPAVFPDAPGMGWTTLLSQGLDLRYDTRKNGDYAERGFRLDVGSAIVEGLAGSPTYLRANVHARALFPELERLSGAARLAWNAVTSRGAPFYRQGSLGGALLLRGFTEDRFIDRQAWTFEIEQRIRVLETHIFGVVADWRADPFVAFGQVFDRFEDALSRPRVAAGVGFRAFVHPNVLGRVDVAYAGEGLKFYVEIGYPF